MSRVDEVLEDRYHVQKRSNPTKRMDCIVLEFDDPIARVGIKAWADEMERKGYKQVASEARIKSAWYENFHS